MKDSVKNIFPEFSRKFEGYVNWMYLDVKGFVTCGIGNLIDPIQLALQLPFITKDGQPATQIEIKSEWQKIKSLKNLAKEGHRSAKKFCNLRLSDDSISILVNNKLEQNEKYLIKNHFPNFNDWPADAQLAVLSMAWALGANFPAKWKTLKSACLSQDWNIAADNCHINEVGNPGIKPRNEANVRLFKSAAEVKTQENQIDEVEKNRILNLVALTMAQSIQEDDYD
jgi:hypothetical protein